MTTTLIHAHRTISTTSSTAKTTATVMTTLAVEAGATTTSTD